MRPIPILLFLTGLAVGCWLTMSQEASPAAPVLTIRQIQPLARLTVLQVEVADAQVARLEGVVGSLSAALIIRGQIHLGTDLQQAQLLDIDTANRSARLLLPQPTALPPRIDHEQTRIFAFSASGLWQLNPQQQTYARLVNAAYQEAEARLTAMARSPHLQEQARGVATSLLDAFFDSIQWEVRIEWVTGP